MTFYAAARWISTILTPSNGPSDFPNELLLEIFSDLPLKGLIAARGVNRTWRSLVPSSNIPPARRALLDLYYDVIQTEDFLSSRRRVIRSLSHFDREVCVAALEGQINGSLPAEFRCWLLEWPEKAVFGWTWPGLHDDFLSSQHPPPGRVFGRNYLGITKPQVDVLKFCEDADSDWDPNIVDVGDPREFEAQALEVWEHGCGWSTWLVLDSADATLNGTLHLNEGTYVHYHDRYNPLRLCHWIEWLRHKPEFISGKREVKLTLSWLQSLTTISTTRGFVQYIAMTAGDSIYDFAHHLLT